MTGSSAVFSPCGAYRHVLERDVQPAGPVFLFCGVNGSTAGEKRNDPTSRKWIGFAKVNGARRYIAVNPFGFCATKVRDLASAADPVGPLNAFYVADAIKRADVLIPCWGSRLKLPPRLRPYLDTMRDQLFASGKPVKVFGFTASGDPLHPLMLGYATPLIDWKFDGADLL